MDNVLRLNSIQIREIAEYAQSVRGVEGEPTFFVLSYDPTTGTFQLKPDPTASRCSNETQVSVPADTFTLQPSRLPVQLVQIQAKGMKEPECLGKYDAVFWSEAAVEKFVFPYYASKGQWAAAHVLNALSKVFYGFVPVPAGSAQNGEAGTIPFAVAHIPRSDYEGIDPTATHSLLGHDLAILFKDEQGTVTHRRLAEFL